MSNWPSTSRLEDLVKIRFTRTYTSTAGRWGPGDELDVPNGFARKVIADGYAEEVATPKRPTRKRGNANAETAVDEDRESR